MDNCGQKTVNSQFQIVFFSLKLVQIVSMQRNGGYFIFDLWTILNDLVNLSLSAGRYLGNPPLGIDLGSFDFRLLLLHNLICLVDLLGSLLYHILSISVFEDFL